MKYVTPETTPRVFISMFLILILASCSEIRTSNGNDAYKYWAGVTSPDEVELLDGQYWQSGHWTKEYVLYLRLKSTDEWWDAFLMQNNLVKSNGNRTIPTDCPAWFRPTDKFILYQSSGDFGQSSRYFRDTTTGISYIYEIQL